jgi:hypothetical protein
MLAAEGLDIGTSLSWWNGPEFKPPDGMSSLSHEPQSDREGFVYGPDAW